MKPIKHGPSWTRNDLRDISFEGMSDHELYGLRDEMFKDLLQMIVDAKLGGITKDEAEIRSIEHLKAVELFKPELEKRCAMENAAANDIIESIESVRRLIEMKDAMPDSILYMGNAHMLPQYILVATVLINKCPNVNISTASGNTPIGEAARAGYIPFLEQLFAKGADLNHAPSPEQAPLVRAAIYGKLDVIKWLASKGATIMGPDRVGDKALWHAARRGYLDVVEWLFQNGADLNTKDKDGVSALSAAASNNKINIVKYLVVHGADINSRDNNGRTALNYAYGKGIFFAEFSQIAKLLMKHGAIK